MRSEKEIYDTILDFARRDENVRLVGLNGSRANPEAPRDDLQDFDIALVVRDMKPYISDRSFIDVFGERLILQTPEDMELYPPALGGWFSFLMLFKDFNRIDLMLVPLKDLNKYLSERLTVILLDKDGAAAIPPPSAREYYLKKISPRSFDNLCNEFWWLSAYVVKGIRRKEQLYAIDHLNSMRAETLKVLAQIAAWPHNYRISVGKNYKYLNKYLAPELFDRLLATFEAVSLDAVARSLKALTALFSDAAREFSSLAGYDYPISYERNMTYYLEQNL